MIGIMKNNPTHPRSAATNPGNDEPVRWIVIAIVSWAEAEVMRSKLESEGIPCLLQRESAGVAIGLTIGPMGEVRVLVPEPLAERARDLLGSDADDLADDTIEDELADDATDSENPNG
jgi:hypothetical protein